ncbi:MAG: hypothetical protein ACK4GL_04355 [Flavobacteriales bacterium]
MLKSLLLVSICFLFLNCNSDRVRVRFSVSCTGFCDIVFAVNGNFPSYENRTGNWRRNFRVDHGSPYFLSVTPTGNFSSATASIYIDKELFRTETSNIPFGTILLDGNVP